MAIPGEPVAAVSTSPHVASVRPATRSTNPPSRHTARATRTPLARVLSRSGGIAYGLLLVGVLLTVVEGVE